MEGLDDTSPLRPKSATNHIRSFSFHVNPSSIASPLYEPATELPENIPKSHQSENPPCLQTSDNNSDSNSVFSSNDTSMASEFDTEVITEFRKSLEILPPANPFSINPSAGEKNPPSPDGYDEDSLDVTSPKKSLQNGFVNHGKNNSPPRVKNILQIFAGFSARKISNAKMKPYGVVHDGVGDGGGCRTPQPVVAGGYGGGLGWKP
ncbi:hypothetical protein R6Q59_034514 [Mikania micrantha]